MCFQAIENLLRHPLQQAKFRRSRVTVEQAIRLHERDRRKSVVFDRIEEIDRVFDVRRALRRIAHDRRRVGFEVADIAVGCPHQEGWVRGVGIVLQFESRVIGAAIVSP